MPWFTEPPKKALGGCAELECAHSSKRRAIITANEIGDTENKYGLFK
jgi:hypothetical protein